MTLSSVTTKSSRPVTIKHLAATLAEEHQLTKRSGEAILVDLVGLMTKHLKKGEKIRISGLGILQVRKRAARMGRNPATGESIKIKACKKGCFPRIQGIEASGIARVKNLTCRRVAFGGHCRERMANRAECQG